MDIRGCTALVTGTNRGIGSAYIRALLARGAAHVYAGARDPSAIRLDDLSAGDAARVTRVALDITRDDQVAAAARDCRDVTLLINNAGVARFEPLLETDDLDAARAEMEVNYFGTLRMCRAFAPLLGARGGGALVNVLSVASWINAPLQGSYSASKAAEWSLTRGVRIELRAQGTLVVGVHMGYIDTDMAAHISTPKTPPSAVAEATLDAVEAGRIEVVVDQRARDMRALLGDPDEQDRMAQGLWDARPRRVR